MVGIIGPKSPCEEVLIKHLGEKQYNVTYEKMESYYQQIQAAGFHSLSYFDIGTYRQQYAFTRIVATFRTDWSPVPTAMKFTNWFLIDGVC